MNLQSISIENKPNLATAIKTIYPCFIQSLQTNENYGYIAFAQKDDGQPNIIFAWLNSSSALYEQLFLHKSLEVSVITDDGQEYFALMSLKNHEKQNACGQKAQAMIKILSSSSKIDTMKDALIPIT